MARHHFNGESEEMTFRERFKRVLHFQKVDRVPNVEIGYWEDTFKRWQSEGLPHDIPFRPKEGDKRYSRNSKELTEYFGLDAHDVAYNISIGDELEPSPTLEVITEDKETKTIRWSHGYMIKCLKANEGIFNELDWPVKNREDWERIKNYYYPGWHRITGLTKDFPPTNDRDFPATLTLPGFFWELRRWMGFEMACTVFYENPEWAFEMLNFWSDYLLAQCKLVLEYYKPEYVQFDEDMAYKHGPMLSPETMERFLVPQYQKVVSYINSRGTDVVGIDSDGLLDEMISVFYKAGINLWDPFEIICRKGKDDLLTLGRKYPWLRMMGGIDKTVLTRGKEAIDEEVSKIIPLVKRGGYIPTIDHKVPPEVSLDAYKYYLQQKARALIIK